MDELKQIVEGGFDVVPAMKLLALRLLQAEQDLARLAVSGPVEDVPGQAPAKRAPSGKAAT